MSTPTLYFEYESNNSIYAYVGQDQITLARITAWAEDALLTIYDLAGNEAFTTSARNCEDAKELCYYAVSLVGAWNRKATPRQIYYAHKSLNQFEALLHRALLAEQGLPQERKS